MIKEAFERQNNEDLIIIGNLVSQALNSDFGKLLNLLINNLKLMEVNNSRNNIGGSSDKVLGRLEAYDTVLNDLQGFISRMEELQQPIQTEVIDEELASEQYTRPMGGEV